MKAATEDQLPPHDFKAEQGALGCAIQDASLAPELREEWFFDIRHRQVATTLIGLASEGKPVDTATLCQRMNSTGIVDAVALVDACDHACHSPANFPFWRDILAEKLTLRRIGQVCTEFGADVIRADRDATRTPADCLDDFERAALAIRQHGNSTGETDIRATMQELTTEYEQAATEGRPRGLTTAFKDLDRLIGGLKPQQLFIIAARPSVGKTTLALNMAEYFALGEGLPVGFFSLEMSAKELLHRLACSRGRVDGSLLNEGRASATDIERLHVAMVAIRKAPLHICEQGGLTIAQLTARARRMLQKHGIKVLIVDYLGLLRSGEKGRSRYEETTLVSNSLKALAKELNLPVIVLAQLNRDNDRENRAPRLSDLRDSGAIEQDADIVALLHRDDNQTGARQSVKIIVAKHRSGATGTADLIFHRAFTRFENPGLEP